MQTLDTTAIRTAIEKCLEGMRPGALPRITDVIASSTPKHVECIFEIAPGQLMRTGGEPDRHSATFHSSMARTAVETALLWSETAATVDPMRMRFRTLVAEAQARGLPVRFLGCDLAGVHEWASTVEPRLLLGMEVLGPNLRPEECWHGVASTDELELMFADAMVELDLRARRRWALGMRGADGSVDALAMAAIRRQDDPGRTIARLGNERHLKLGDGSLLMWSDGHVCSASGSSDDPVSWLDDLVVVCGSALPATVCSASIGKPITALIDHPAFDPDMIITNVDVVRGERPTTRIALRLDDFLIDTTRGTYWRSRKHGVRDRDQGSKHPGG